MADIYVYDAFEENLDTAGMVGALMPTSCEYYPEAGTIGEIQMEHPYDKYGKWRALVIGNILKAGVCMPTLPIISGNKIVTSVEVYKVKSASVATAAQRYIYKDATSDKKSKLLPGGTAVTIMSRPAEEKRLGVGDGGISKRRTAEHSRNFHNSLLVREFFYCRHRL